jgi:hypothetical protein
MRVRSTEARWWWVSRKSFNNMLYAARWWQNHAGHPCCSHCGPAIQPGHKHYEPCVLCMYDGEVYDA